MTTDPMDGVFEALGNAARRRMLDILQERPGCLVHELADRFDMSRIGVMKHLRILERADLVHSERVGRARRLYFNVMPIRAIYDRWTDRYSAFWAERLSDIKARAESGARRKAVRCA